MHTAESIRSLTGQGFLKLIDQCDPEELTFLLSAMWGDAPDTLAGALNIVEQRRAEPEPLPAADPTGLCGHPVTPGARAMGFVKCRDCLAGNPSAVATYDRATADEQMAAAVSA